MVRINIEEDVCDGGMSVSVHQEEGVEEISIGLELFYDDSVVMYEAEGTTHAMGPFQTEVRHRLDRDAPAPLFEHVDAAAGYDDVEDGFRAELDDAYSVTVEEGRLREGAQGPFWYGTLERGSGDVGIGDLLARMEEETGIDAQHYYDRCRAKHGL